jgi:hypothetical protein
MVEGIVAWRAAPQGEWSMASDDGRSDNGRSDDPDVQEFMDEVEQHGRAIYELVSDYMDDLEVPESIISHVLLNLAFNMRMVAYVIDTEKPSAGGLKLDLDRMRNEIEQLVRESKKGAEGFIVSAKAAIAEAEKEPEED